MSGKPDQGDYVLATKFHDGDPQDQWCVGFYDRSNNGRHYVVNENGVQFRANGFRRAAKISKERGEFILNNIKNIQIGRRSLWWWKRVSMKGERGGR